MVIPMTGAVGVQKGTNLEQSRQVELCWGGSMRVVFIGEKEKNGHFR